ncbi:MAG: outer membrane beta-barrel family protein, partial [Bacteroidota bacterium]
NFNYGAEKWNVYGTLSYRFAETELTYDENILNYNREVSPNFIRNLHIWEESLATQNYKLGFVSDPFKNHVFGFEGYVRVQNENVDNDGTISAEHNGTELDVGTADFDREQDNNLYNMTFNYSWKMDSINSQFNLFAEYLNKQTDGFSAANSVYQKGVFDNSAERFNSKVGTEIYSVQADFTKRFKKNLNLEMGLLATYIDRENDLLSDFLVNNEWVENERSNAFTYTEEIVGGYISMSKRFKEKNFFQIGLRLEDTKLERIELLDNSVIEQDYLNLFPSVYFSRDLKNGNSLSANFSRKFRRPDFYFLNNYVIKLNDFSFEQGNPDLRPEFVNKLQVSFNQSNQTTAAYFHKTTNAINPTYTLDGSVAFFQLKNIGERTQYGIEYNRFGNINKWWFIKGMVDVFYRYFTDDNGQNSFKTFAGYMTLSNTFKINKTTSFDISGEYESPHKDAFINKSYNYYIDLMLQKTFLDNQLTCRIYLFDVFHNWRHVDKRPFETFETNFNLRYRTRMLRLWVGYNFASKSKVSERKIQSKNDAKDRVW